MKMNHSIQLGMWIVMSMFAIEGHASDIYVIANSASTVSAAEVRDMYSPDKGGGASGVLYENAASQKDFLEKVINMDPPRYKDAWAKKVFRDGVNPPVMKANDQDIVAAVKSNPRAVGYVSSAPSGVRVVTSLSSPVIDLKSCEAPKYPKSALLNEEVGTVDMEFVVGADGKLVDSRISKSSSSKSLDKAAIAAYSLCRFSPGKRDGKVDQSILTISYTWKLD